MNGAKDQLERTAFLLLPLCWSLFVLMLIVQLLFSDVYVGLARGLSSSANGFSGENAWQGSEEASRHILGYLKGHVSGERMREQLSRDGEFISALEVDHLQDVREVMIAAGTFIRGIFLPLVVLVLWRKMRASGDKWENRAWNLMLLSPLLLAVVALLAFPLFFVLFHEALFPQGGWTLPGESLLIRLYPSDFWQLSGVVLFIFWFVFTLAGKLFLARQSPKKAYRAPSG